MLLLLLCFFAATASLPSGGTGLLVSFKPTPALSVPVLPTFTWVVPPSPHTPDATQAAYRLQVWSAVGSGALAWDSGRVASNASVSVRYGGAPLRSSSPYLFNVTTYLSDGTMATTPPAAFTTALAASDWAPNASYVWSSNASGVFALIRHELTLPAAPVALALLHASARTGDDTILVGYKVYLEGALVGVGPGRGEARVWGGDSAFRGLPYATYDLTPLLPAPGGRATLAAAGVGAWFGATRGMLLQLDLHHPDGSVTSLATGSPSSPFAALSGDAYYNPTQPLTKEATAYRPVHEYTDARVEPVGWLQAGFAPPAPWAPAAVTLPLTDPQAVQGLTALMAQTLQVVPAQAQGTPTPLTLLNASYALADFGAEFQGGVALQVAAGVQGARLTLSGGESLTENSTAVGSTWGYTFTWTLRAGAQTLEQLQYMEFRHLSLAAQGADGTPLALAALGLTLSAWRVAAAWDDSASAFHSPNATLNAVWQQSRYTQQAGLLDTYTDSNTRERRVYECDGLIAASGRLLVQGDVAWVRHSHTYVLAYPTWPVEWLQMTPLLAWQDYWATGSPDLAAGYLQLLLDNTHYSSEVDGSGLLNTSHGRHIVDWDPWPTEARFKQSSHLSVTQFFALAGLRAVAQLAQLAGNATLAALAGARADSLQAAVLSLMLQAPQPPPAPPGPLFCDGACADPRVANFTSVISSAWALFSGAAQAASPAASAAAWQRIASEGLEGYGSYGAFIYLSALASAGPGEGDDGTALLTALTKCDSFSWCGEMQNMGASMTRESWTDPTATYSHPWGTSPLLGIAQGLMGLRQTAPAWGEFTVAPRLGGLGSASLRIPTLRGSIAVQANGSHTVLAAPCGSLALLCVAPEAGVVEGRELGGLGVLSLDGEDARHLAVLFPPWHVCVRGVGCGAAGAPRTLMAA